MDTDEQTTNHCEFLKVTVRPFDDLFIAKLTYFSLYFLILCVKVIVEGRMTYSIVVLISMKNVKEWVNLDGV